MILHLLFDSQFSDYVIEQFSSENMFSDFVLISETNKMKFSKKLGLVPIVNPNVESEMNQLIINIEKYNAVIFHGLFHPWQEWLLNRWPNKVKKAWVCWGGEIYGQHDIRSSFLKPLSRIIFSIHKLKKSRNREFLFPKKSIQNFEYCITNLKPEYECVKQYLNTNIKFIPYNYYSIDDTLGELKNSKCNGRNIFVGNSATIENNFLEILLKLKSVGTDDRQIILPLSYGEPWVRNICLKLGKYLFKNNFNPLLTFIPREDYNAKMLDCSVMIQAHLREQAHGNIVTGLWLGTRVYLSKNSIAYKHFKGIDCKVFSIEDDLIPNNANAFSPLSEEEIMHNRRMLIEFYGKEAVLKNASELVNILNN